MKTVVLDDVDGAFRASGELSRLEAMGGLVVYDREARSGSEVLERLKGADVAVAIRDRTLLDRETLANLSELKLIASTGPHRIDFKAATELGIVVTTTPGVSNSAVGEHVFAMILSLARRVTASDQALRQGCWEPVPGMELEGKTLGILGLGRTGGAVARHAAGVNTPHDLGLSLLPPGVFGVAFALNAVTVVGADASVLLATVVAGTIGSEIVARFLPWVDLEALATTEPPVSDSTNRGQANGKTASDVAAVSRLGEMAG